ncbi:MAG: hypothetical protein JGK30_07830 [Microcoleus sp. PH2017_40_RAT_O_B]|uniref:hypothetical protein n=1 Tax=unclassified Microcoleus TaxID=2642155 RepID=UPI001D4B4F4B|nr:MULTISPECIES: hypothetical protein [unclassified Microcoleus]MCC3572174.1 hypothetical protein [Microcoleus sp. PH2017_34_RAT_O_A]MCC3609411.1 hypothetical protein [Microcoleus sp. PH2017_40_RAT_O_B]TAG60296.1 MAG: hypothetical protein EAZ28_07910 [Oscillatoriales cyanobacterium]
MSLLKVSALSISGVCLWLAPPFIFSRKIPLHNFIQGVALASSFACCFEARRCALKVAKAEEFEAMKDAAVAADLVDEISTSVYVSEQQRRQEAELILASQQTSHAEVASTREALEAQWREEFELASTSAEPIEIPSDLLLWREVEAATSEGKTQTWIIENILKMKGRKFADGKAKLAELTLKFGSNF